MTLQPPCTTIMPILQMRKLLGTWAQVPNSGNCALGHFAEQIFFFTCSRVGTSGVGTLLVFYLLGPGVGKELKDHEGPVAKGNPPHPGPGPAVRCGSGWPCRGGRARLLRGRGGCTQPSWASCRKGKLVCPFLAGSDFVAFAVSLIKI